RPALHAGDCEPGGFEWLSGEDWQHSVLGWMRHGPGETVVAVLNFTPVVREGYRIGVPEAGRWTRVEERRVGRERRCVGAPAEDGIRDFHVTGVQTCALPISGRRCTPATASPAASSG